MTQLMMAILCIFSLSIVLCTRNESNNYNHLSAISIQKSLGKVKTIFHYQLLCTLWLLWWLLKRHHSLTWFLAPLVHFSVLLNGELLREGSLCHLLAVASPLFLYSWVHLQHDKSFWYTCRLIVHKIINTLISVEIFCEKNVKLHKL